MRLLTSAFDTARGAAQHDAYLVTECLEGYIEGRGSPEPVSAEDYMSPFDTAGLDIRGYLGPLPSQNFDRAELAIDAIVVGMLVLLKQQAMANHLLGAIATRDIALALRPRDIMFHDEFVIPPPAPPPWWKFWRRR